jgi:hypothetical protein
LRALVLRRETLCEQAGQRGVEDQPAVGGVVMRHHDDRLLAVAIAGLCEHVERVAVRQRRAPEP